MSRASDQQNTSRDDQSLAEIRDDDLQHLGGRRNQLLADGDRFLSSLPSILNDTLVALLVTFKVTITALLSDYDGIAAEIAALRAKRAEHLRAVMVDHGITKPKIPKDLWNIAIFAQGGLVLETIIVSATLILGGTMSIPASVSLAFVFALATVLFGLLAGHSLSYALYKQASSHKTPNDLRIRRRGRAGFWGCIVVIVLIIYVGVRSRVTGGHEDALRFDEVGFLETFASDSMVYIMIAVAGFSAILSIFKGHQIDPVVGLRDMHNYAYRDTLAHMDEAGGGALDRLDAHCGKILDRLYDIEAAVTDADELLQDQLDTINHDRRAYNGSVQATKSALVAELERRIVKYERVSGQPVDPRPDLALDAYDALILPLLSSADFINPSVDTVQLADVEGAISEIENLTDEHEARIEASLARFRAMPPDLSPVSLPKGVFA